MSAFFHDLPLFYHNDMIGNAHCRKSVGNKNRRATLGELLKPLENLLLGFGVQSRRWFIKDEYISFFPHKRARQRDLLPLTT